MNGVKFKSYVVTLNTKQKNKFCPCVLTDSNKIVFCKRYMQSQIKIVPSALTLKIKIPLY